MNTVPTAPIRSHTIETHGHARQDNYYWMREREDPELLAYLNAENDYLKEGMQHTEQLQEDIYKEIRGRIKEDDSSVPYQLDHFIYYVKYIEGNEYPIYCRKDLSSLDLQGEDLLKLSEGLPEEVLIDVNELAKDKSYCSVANVKPSPNHEWLAVAIDIVGRRIYNIRFRNLKTGEWTDYELPYADGSVAWANDNNTVFYTTKHPSTLRSDTIRKHKLHSDPEKDAIVFHEQDEEFLTQVSRGKSGDLIFIGSYSSITTEIQYIDSNNPDEPPVSIYPREKGLEYHAAYYNNKFYILCNDRAQNFKLMIANKGQSHKKHWKELIPHRPNVLLEDVELFREFLVLEEREAGLTQLRVVRHNGNGKLGDAQYIDLKQEAYMAGTSKNPNFDTPWLRYYFNSLTTPASIYDYNMDTGEQVLRKQQEVPNTDLNAYDSKRIWVKARDGVKVPVSMVFKKGIDLKAENPLLLYGYGSYGISIDPYFSASRLSLLDRGFVFAIAHIRGGQELGRAWYEEAKYLKKWNTFNDFIDCAQYLVDKKYTSPEKLVANGGSAGGLLMGTVINKRPDLFKAVAADVPFVDVVTTMLDESIPLTTGEFEEWGNPKNKEYYDYMLSYSPYDQVKPQDYPALLVTSGLHDSQVQYWEPTKWVAKLRATKTDKQTLYLKTNMEAGHGGASGRFETLKETALTYAFFLDQLGMV